MKTDKILETIEKKFKGKAVNSYDGCEYQASSGKKCAIGIFLHKVTKNINSCGGVHDLLTVYPTFIQYMPSKNKTQLREFQRVHDGGSFDNFEDINNLTLDEQKMYLQFEALRIFKK